MKKKTKILENELVNMKANEVLGQIASAVESKIVHLVLDNIVNYCDHDIETISGLEKALKGIEPYNILSTDQKRAAQNYWDTLKQDLEWSNTLQRYTKTLKRFRNDVAHLDIDQGAVETALANHVIPRLNAPKFEKLWRIYKRLYRS